MFALRCLFLVGFSLGSQIGGPVWIGPLHNVSFVDQILDVSKGMSHPLHTQARIDGMLSVAKEVCGPLNIDVFI